MGAELMYRAGERVVWPVVGGDVVRVHTEQSVNVKCELKIETTSIILAFGAYF
jgi:hypothetical protein